jgi:SAM-dependent methyltransferase
MLTETNTHGNSTRGMLVMKRMLNGKTFSSVLDVGCSTKDFKNYVECEKYVGLDRKPWFGVQPDVIADFNKKDLPFKDSAFDMVVLSMVLEYAEDPERLVKEALRVSRHYVLVGIPNYYAYDDRFRMLLGKNAYPFGDETGPNWIIGKRNTDKFIGGIKGAKVTCRACNFTSSGGRMLPEFFKSFLLNLRPSLFAKEFYFLFEKEVKE